MVAFSMLMALLFLSQRH